MNDIIDTITGLSIIALLSVGCTSVKQQPEPIRFNYVPSLVQTQVPEQTIEQFFTPPPPGVNVKPPNWPPHLHIGAHRDPFTPDISTLDVFILQGEVPLTF